MQCSCGGETEDRQSVKDGKVIIKYKVCKSCGRVNIYFDATEKEKHWALGMPSKHDYWTIIAWR